MFSIAKKFGTLGYLTAVIFIALSFGSVAKAVAPLDLYLFWGEGCPHCSKEKDFLAEVLPKYPNAELKTFEVYHSQANVDLMQQVSEKLRINASGVPFLVIGDKGFVGFAEGTTTTEITKQIEECSKLGCPDSVSGIVGQGDAKDKNTTVVMSEENQRAASPESKVLTLPFVGEIDALNFSLPLLTILMGALDGFNPCAMWTLLFLISLLLGFEDRKKMWILGGVFIVASALTYSLFMMAWLQLILFLGLVIWVRLGIGGLAIIGGGYNIKKGIANKDGGCEVTGSEKRQAVFKRLREITKNKSLLLAIGGIMVLAFAVNLVELVCSAGLPAVYTQVLSMSNISGVQYLGYIFLYVLFFMLDDIVIFAIAMTTLKMTGISTKYARWSSLVGGVLMVIIGILLIFKPEWLLFG